MTSPRRDLARRSKLLERVLLDLLRALLDLLQHLKLRQGWDQVHTGLRLVDLLQEVLEVLEIGLEILLGILALRFCCPTMRFFFFWWYRICWWFA